MRGVSLAFMLALAGCIVDGRADESSSSESGGQGQDPCLTCADLDCAGALSECEAATDCVCWDACAAEEPWESCAERCGERPGTWERLATCRAAASAPGGSCESECIDVCERCWGPMCAETKAACDADAACTCWLACLEGKGELACEAECGASPPTRDALLACVLGTIADPSGQPGVCYGACI